MAMTCGAAGILGTVRRMLAFVVALGVTAVAWDSPLFCADGCDRSDTAHHDTTHVPCGSCVTCQSGSLPETRTDVAPSLRLIDIAVRDHLAPLTPRSKAIEHPPRTA
jgi:hypothetical protein